jgi:hypothetical protein
VSCWIFFFSPSDLAFFHEVEKLDGKHPFHCYGTSAVPKPKEIVVTCNLNEGSVTRVEKRLRDLGFKIDSVLEFAGSITGRWEDSLETLRKIPEVDAVEESEMKYPQ